MEVKDQVLQAMRKAGKALKAGEIAEAAKLDKAVVEKAMKVLKEEGKIESPVRCFWQAK